LLYLFLSCLGGSARADINWQAFMPFLSCLGGSARAFF
tara:strand:- start:7982 stop:8095 length:114 start_codon:yes stop_codon:yes gene_type:complete